MKVSSWILGIFSLCAIVLLSILTARAGSPYDDVVDFVVEVESGRDIRVLQLTDTQILDAAQAREGREGVDYVNWDTDKMPDKLFDYATEVIEGYNPDLILITGDLVYGEFDDNGTALIRLIEFMDSFKIPWAPVFGNHDQESARGADWQCQKLEQSKYCLFKQRELTGNGNYSVGVVQDEQLVRVFYMLDSNGCGDSSTASLANGHTQTSVGFGTDQIEWYTQSIQTIKEKYPNTKISMGFHIQLQVWADALEPYGYSSSVQSGTSVLSPAIDLDTDTDETSFGYIGRTLKSGWDTDYTVWNGIKELGVDSIFVGHEHCNSGSVVYDGIRLTYGLKTGTYDRSNYRTSDGSITGSYSVVGDPVIGGTAIVLDSTGTIKDCYHIYCTGENDSSTEITLQEEISAESVITDIKTQGLGDYTKFSGTDDTIEGCELDNIYKASNATYMAETGVSFGDRFMLDKKVYLRYYIPKHSYSNSGDTPEELGFTRVTIADFGFGEGGTYQGGSRYGEYTGSGTLDGKYLDVDLQFPTDSSTNAKMHYLASEQGTGLAIFMWTGSTEGGLALQSQTSGTYNNGYNKTYSIAELGLDSRTEKFNLKLGVQLVGTEVQYTMWINDVLIVQDVAITGLTSISNGMDVAKRTNSSGGAMIMTVPEVATEQSTPEELGFTRVTIADFGFGEGGTYQSGSRYGEYTGSGTLDGKYLDVDLQFPADTSTNAKMHYLASEQGTGLGIWMWTGTTEGGLALQSQTSGTYNNGYNKTYSIAELGLDSRTEKFNLKLGVQLVGTEVQYTMWINDVLIVQDVAITGLTSISNGMDVTKRTNSSGGAMIMTVPEVAMEQSTPEELGFTERVTIADFGLNEGNYSATTSSVYAYTGSDGLDNKYLDVDMTFTEDSTSANLIYASKTANTTASGVRIYYWTGYGLVIQNSAAGYDVYTASDLNLDSLVGTKFNLKLGVKINNLDDSGNCDIVYTLWINDILIAKDVDTLKNATGIAWNMSFASGTTITVGIPTVRVTQNKPQWRLFSNDAELDINSGEGSVYSTVTTVYGKWMEVDITSQLQRFLNEDGTMQEFVLCYRSYAEDIEDADVNVYFGGFKLEWTDVSTLFQPLYVTFMADGNYVDDPVAFAPYTDGLDRIPMVPKKEGYIGSWEAYTLGKEDIIVNAVYEAGTFLVGDLNQDGTLDNRDIILMRKRFVDLFTCEEVVADMDETGDVDVRDLIRMKKLIGSIT